MSSGNKTIAILCAIFIVCIGIWYIVKAERLTREVIQLTQERDVWQEMALHYYGRADEFLVSIDSITEIYFPDSTLKQEDK